MLSALRHSGKDARTNPHPGLGRATYTVTQTLHTHIQTQTHRRMYRHVSIPDTHTHTHKHAYMYTHEHTCALGLLTFFPISKLPSQQHGDDIHYSLSTRDFFKAA